MDTLRQEAILVTFLPLLGALVAGLFGKVIGRKGSHVVTIGLMVVATVYAIKICWGFVQGALEPMNTTLYTWAMTGGIPIQVGFLIDELTALMIAVVTFVSLMVHIYTIGYMADDPGYQRFFSYISLFTFSMLMLVMANNFMQLFFGWEAVGLVSYLLIGFWFKRESAIFANLKAFLVNRVGDFGFLLGIAGVLYLFGSLDYNVVFAGIEQVAKASPSFQISSTLAWPAITVTCICLFVGAMGKSAQVPLHVWLPDSMEGPTPISALIHAATMVTAGVFMVARLSPIFELSDIALSVVMVIGAITCFFMGLLGIVANDIKRVIAYSTLSQLGYMVTALGASAYAAGIFHLMTHAFFKALLFLGAGSAIIAMHHEQDIRKMGGLRKYMPITYITMLVGSLALIGFPGFSGFYSKDLIIEAVHLSTLPGSNIAYAAVLCSVFVTALYSFRLLFMVFHGSERMDIHTRDHLHESPMVVWLPLVLLAVPSVISGWPVIARILEGYFAQSIVVLPQHDVLATFKEEFHGPWAMLKHGLLATPFWLAMAGVATAWIGYLKVPSLPQRIKTIFKPIYTLLVRKYGFDEFNQIVIAGGVRGIGWLCWRLGDRALIDGLAVNGSAKSIGMLAKVSRKVQTGYLYHYAFAMITGFFVLLVWLVVFN